MFEHGQQALLELYLGPCLCQCRTTDDKDIFHTFAQREDFGCLQIDAMRGKYLGQRMEQTGAIGAHDRQMPRLAAFDGV